LSDAPKQEERDFVYGNPVGLGNHRVRQLVREQAGKEKQAREDCRAPHQCVTPITVHGMELRDERKSDQQRDYQPTVVQSQLNPEYRTQLNLRFHDLSPPELHRNRQQVSPIDLEKRGVGATW
jgi:hypothetical protein